MILQDKVVVVTGGAGLIGKGFIESIVQHGGIGVVADINLEAAKTAKQAICEKLVLLFWQLVCVSALRILILERVCSLNVSTVLNVPMRVRV